MIKITKMIEPMFNRIITTHRQYTREDAQTIGGLFTKMEGKTMEYQKVLAIGPNVKGVKVGDTVCIDPFRYAQLLHKEGLTNIDKKITEDDMRMATIFPTETIYTKGEDGVETSQTVMILFDSDILYTIPEGGYEEFHPTLQVSSGIIVPPGGLLKTKN